MGTGKKDVLWDHERFKCQQNGDPMSPSACSSGSVLFNNRISCSLATVSTAMKEPPACPRTICGALQGHRANHHMNKYHQASPYVSWNVRLVEHTFIHIARSHFCFLLYAILTKFFCFTTESATTWGLELPSPRVVGQHKGHVGALRRGR